MVSGTRDVTEVLSFQIYVPTTLEYETVRLACVGRAEVRVVIWWVASRVKWPKCQSFALSSLPVTPFKGEHANIHPPPLTHIPPPSDANDV